MRPRGLAETTIAMCGMNIAGFLFVDPQLAPIEMQYAIFGVIIAASYLVLWYYWMGKNWARILVLLGGGLAVVNLLGFSSASFWEGALIIVEAIFGIFMLWWLNTKSIKAYFKDSSA